MSKLTFRIKEGDTCGVEWNDTVEKEARRNKNLYPISYDLANAMSSGKIPVATVQNMILRGGNPETLLEDPPEKEDKPAEDRKTHKRAKKVEKAAEPELPNPFNADGNIVVNA